MYALIIIYYRCSEAESDIKSGLQDFLLVPLPHLQTLTANDLVCAQQRCLYSFISPSNIGQILNYKLISATSRSRMGTKMVVKIDPTASYVILGAYPPPAPTLYGQQGCRLLLLHLKLIWPDHSNFAGSGPEKCTSCCLS